MKFITSLFILSFATVALSQSVTDDAVILNTTTYENENESMMNGITANTYENENEYETMANAITANTTTYEDDAILVCQNEKGVYGNYSDYCKKITKKKQVRANVVLGIMLFGFLFSLVFFMVRTMKNKGAHQDYLNQRQEVVSYLQQTSECLPSYNDSVSPPIYTENNTSQENQNEGHLPTYEEVINITQLSSQNQS